MKACAITDKGLEKVAVLELDEMIGLKGKAEECVVLFEPKAYDNLFKFCYFSQSIERVILLFANFEFKESKDLLSKFEKELKKINLKEWFDKNTTFKVECKRIGKHDFGSLTTEKFLGEKIILKTKKDLGFTPKANMDSPDLIIYIFINNNKAYFGIDLCGRDLSKRQYRIFTSPGTINANLCYALIRLGKYSKNQKLVDPFCKSGIVCIEGALYASGISVNYYSKDFAFKKLRPFLKKDWESFFKKMDSKSKPAKLDITGFDSLLKNIEAAKKNSKLAGVDKIINFSKIDVEWLDTKLEKASVDIIASRISCPSKHVSVSFVKKLYKELFYQAEFVMKKTGRMVLLTENTKLIKESLTNEFKLIREHVLWAGKQRYQAVLIKKK